MSDNEEDALVVAVDRPVLVDFEGNDALGQSEDEIKFQIQKYATAALPSIFVRALAIATQSTNHKNAIEAMKLIKSMSEGTFSGKVVESAAKKIQDADLEKELERK